MTLHRSNPARRFTGAGLGALAMVALASCGGSPNTAPPATAPANSDLVVRAKPAISWDQSGYAAASHNGTLIVTLVNDSGYVHNLHIVDGNGDDIDKSAPKLGVRKMGDESTGTFTLTPGRYTVVCKVPGHGNMKSTLTVT